MLYGGLFKTILIMAVTFLVAMLLLILPMPNWAIWLRPQWVFLVLLFWLIRSPQRIGIGFAWFIGLLQDLLTGVLLGQHAFVYAIIAYLIIKFHSQVRHLTLWQQTIMVFILLMLNLTVQYLIMGIAGLTPDPWIYWCSAFTSAIFWPWVYLLLKHFQPNYQIVYK